MMRFAARWLVLLLLGGSALAQETKSTAPVIPVEEYGTRRATLRKVFEGGLMLMEADPLLPGIDNIDANTPVYDFFYLVGYHREGDVLALRADGTAVLFAGDKAEEARSVSGIKDVRPSKDFEKFLKEELPKAKKAYTRLRQATKQTAQAAAEETDAKILSGGGKIAEALTLGRMMKSGPELDMMRKASDATNKAHLEAMRACKPGMNEKELQTLIENKFKAEGCDGLGFASIVGSGKNGTILHYCENTAEIPKGTLVVVDIGAAYRGYVSDITRTLPTDGKFSEAHRKAYQCVLDAQKAAEVLLKPGATFRQLHAAAAAVFKEREMTDWAYSHSKDRSVRHGLSHYVGLAVHDSGLYDRPFEPGVIITIEPGYYNKDDGYGIRIEDIYIVTADGFERMSAGAPREIDEIEKIMKKY